MPDTYVGAVDRGTTGTRFTPSDRASGTHAQVYPGLGRGKHDPARACGDTRTVSRALRAADVDAAQPAGLGVTTQRETGEPVHTALVRQDGHTTDHVEEFEASGDGSERATDRATEGDT